jgi:hypothetical protein
MLTDQTRWSLGRGKPLVPSRWQATYMGKDGSVSVKEGTQCLKMRW